MPPGLDMYVIYDHPLDMPASFVVRRWHVDGAPRPRPDAETHAIVGSLEAARASIPAGLVNIGRESDDDPAIAEVWL